MAERRAIYSGIWDDDLFGNNSYLGMLIWIGLFSKCADDQGRLEDNVVLIKNKLFPYKDIPSQEVEDCLVSFDGHIIRYEVDGKKYIQLAKWWDHQPLKYATPSKFPPPDGWVDRYRTFYKGTHIIYNWPSMENTEAGEKLYACIGSLGRVSSWMDYIGVPNTNTNTNTNHNLNPNPRKRSAPAKPSAPKKGDERLNHPAIKAIRGITKRNPPLTSLDYIIRILGDTPDYQKLTNCIETWGARGYKPTNYEGMLDWYKNGIPERFKTAINQPAAVSIPKRTVNGREETLPPGYTSFAQLDAARAEVARQMQKVAA